MVKYALEEMVSARMLFATRSGSGSGKSEEKRTLINWRRSVWLYASHARDVMGGGNRPVGRGIAFGKLRKAWIVGLG